MSEKTKAQQAHTLVSEFVKAYTKHYRSKPQINRFRERWGFEAMIDDLGFARAKQIIEYYFKTENPGHSVQDLLYKYDHIDKSLSEIEKDEINRAELRAATARRVKEWEEKVGE